eukprot:87179-Rhodomonas_salina.2
MLPPGREGGRKRERERGTDWGYGHRYASSTRLRRTVYCDRLCYYESADTVLGAKIRFGTIRLWDTRTDTLRERRLKEALIPACNMRGSELEDGSRRAFEAKSHYELSRMSGMALPTCGSLHCEIKYKEPQSQYNLYQECGLLCLISHCISLPRHVTVIIESRPHITCTTSPSITPHCTPRNPVEETAISVHFVPGMRFLVFDFGVQSHSVRTNTLSTVAVSPIVLAFPRTAAARAVLS